MVLIKMLVTTAAGLRTQPSHFRALLPFAQSAPGSSETNVGAVLCAPTPSCPKLPVWLQALVSPLLTFLLAPLPSAPPIWLSPPPCPTTTVRQSDPIKHNTSHPISCFKNRCTLAQELKDPQVPPLFTHHMAPRPPSCRPHSTGWSLSSDCWSSRPSSCCVSSPAQEF